MKKVLTIILCALLMGCSSGKSEEDYINITNRITNYGFEINTYDDYSVNLTADLADLRMNINILKTDDNKSVYSLSLYDEDVNGYYAVDTSKNEHYGSASVQDVTVCEYNFETQDGECDDMASKEFIYAIRDLNDQLLDELELSESDLASWGAWYIDNH